MRVAFACPSYGPIDARVVHAQRHALMMAWANGLEVHGDVWIDRAGWDVARNRIAFGFLEGAEESQLDGVFWCDSDIIIPPDALIQLCRPEVDVCTGIYYGRHAPYEPQIHIYNEHVNAWNRILKWPDDGALFPVHGHGFGCVYTSRKALELTQQIDMDGPPKILTDGTIVPQEVRWWFRTGKWGEDLTWCHHARKMGLILWCNPKVVGTHLSEAIQIGADHFEKFYRENKTEAHFAAMTLRKENGTYRAVVENGLDYKIPDFGTQPSVEAKGKEHTVSLDEHLRMTPSA